MYKIPESVHRLVQAGISEPDAYALRRIAMTLHRWYELECGDGNDYASWCITRGRKERRDGQHANGHGAHCVFIHDDDGKPYEERHIHKDGTTLYSAMPDRERGAQKRLAKIMAKYPELRFHLQTDPRGAPLYILPQGVEYPSGVAVYK